MKRRLLRLWFTILARAGLVPVMLCLCCMGSKCAPEPVAPDPIVDAGPDLPDVGTDPVADCTAAGELLERLGCRAVDGSSLAHGPTGEPFAEACVRAFAAGVDYHAGCIATVTDCTQIDSAAQGFLCLEAGAP